MGPAKGSRTINKTIVKGCVDQQQHDDPSSSSKAKQKVIIPFTKDCFILNHLQTTLVASSVFIAFLLPFFGLVMALIGSLLSILVALIMPALCFLKIARDKATRLQVVASVMTVVLGAVCAVLGTYNSIAKIAKSY